MTGRRSAPSLPKAFPALPAVLALVAAGGKLSAPCASQPTPPASEEFGLTRRECRDA
jgi:hypothetical protein